MKLGYQTNTWGGVVGHPAGVTSVKELYANPKEGAEISRKFLSKYEVLKTK